MGGYNVTVLLEITSLSSGERIFEIGYKLTQFSPKFGSQFQGGFIWATLYLRHNDVSTTKKK